MSRSSTVLRVLVVARVAIAVVFTLLLPARNASAQGARKGNPHEGVWKGRVRVQRIDNAFDLSAVMTVSITRFRSNGEFEGSVTLKFDDDRVLTGQIDGEGHFLLQGDGTISDADGQDNYTIQINFYFTKGGKGMGGSFGYGGPVSPNPPDRYNCWHFDLKQQPKSHR